MRRFNLSARAVLPEPILSVIYREVRDVYFGLPKNPRWFRPAKDRSIRNPKVTGQLSTPPLCKTRGRSLCVLRITKRSFMR